MIEQIKFTNFPLNRAFQKPIKAIEDQGRKQKDAITNQNERVAVLTNKDDHKDNYRKYLEIS